MQNGNIIQIEENNPYFPIIWPNNTENGYIKIVTQAFMNGFLGNPDCMAASSTLVKYFAAAQKEYFEKLAADTSALNKADIKIDILNYISAMDLPENIKQCYEKMAQPIFDDETGSLLSLIKPLIEYAKEVKQLKTDNAKLREEVASLNQRVEELELSPGPGPRYVAAAEHFNSLANN